MNQSQKLQLPLEEVMSVSASVRLRALRVSVVRTVTSVFSARLFRRFHTIFS